ncbi:hypothetical protein SADUNF_Sadunf05G0046800 [Salix dunnii]|uniref:Polyadenylate-binding protein 2 n=1 Tax=Salix dunnii TaxID=1413687 RepID=A0A835MYF7_9ROSI|nr:hypothetical protein SADUNF_Sadunf05G0046800 [Salix dunnii]
MEEEEHEVYGGEIPDVEGDMDPHNADIDMPAADDDAVKELDEMKKRLKEMEEEAAALREMQAKVEKEMGAVQDPATAAANQANREEADCRSVFVGNVRNIMFCTLDLLPLVECLNHSMHTAYMWVSYSPSSLYVLLE